MIRQQYLHARATLERLLELGVVPVVNENDAIADDEIRFGDNDRLAALVAHLLGADLLVLLTDTPGLLTADPRLDSDGVPDRGDRRGRPRDRGPGRRHRQRPGERGHGLQARRGQDRRLVRRPGRHRRRPPARRPGRRRGRRGGRHGRPAPGEAPGQLASSGSPSPSARRAPWSSTPVPGGPWSRTTSRCSPPGSCRSSGAFDADDAVEVAGPDGDVFAKGLVKVDAVRLKTVSRQADRRPPRRHPPRGHPPRRPRRPAVVHRSRWFTPPLEGPR